MVDEGWWHHLVVWNIQNSPLNAWKLCRLIPDPRTGDIKWPVTHGTVTFWQVSLVSNLTLWLPWFPRFFLKRPCGGLISWCQPAVCRCHLPELESALSSAATWATVQLQLQKNPAKQRLFSFNVFPYMPDILSPNAVDVTSSNQIKSNIFLFKTLK